MLLMLRGLFRMLNNKGQSLILFVIVLPILLVILVLVIDIGRVISLKQELDNVNKIVLDYGLDNLNNTNVNGDNYNDQDNQLDNSIDDEIVNNDEDVNIINNISDIEDELIELVKLNKNDIDLVDVRIENNKIYIELNEKVDGIFSSLIDISVFDVKSYYVGYMNNDSKRIERVNG